MIELVLQREIPSQNRRDRVHWSKRHGDTKAWELHLRAAVATWPTRPTSKMRVHITSYRTRLIHDVANLHGGAKGLCDALVRIGLIHDDSDKWADITYEQHQAPKPDRCTRVTITAIQGTP